MLINSKKKYILRRDLCKQTYVCTYRKNKEKKIVMVENKKCMKAKKKKGREIFIINYVIMVKLGEDIA